MNFSWFQHRPIIWYWIDIPNGIKHESSTKYQSYIDMIQRVSMKVSQISIHISNEVEKKNGSIEFKTECIDVKAPNRKIRIRTRE